MPDILSSLRWQDIVDILVVSYVIYRIILLIRGTRAGQMLVGISVVTLIYFISNKLDFLTLQWLLRYLLSSLPIIMLIVFQRDIRRALTQMGKSPFLKSRDIPAHGLSEVISAAVYMARRRIGALIIIERENGLRDYVESGFHIDAILSHELLVAIFFPMSPMHDGGVIIEKGRIHSAGCLLPLSKSQNIAKRYGTRHRAALGLSEETDAVIIVVSEETQEISIVQGGNITPMHDEAKLDSMLKTIFLLHETTTPKWKKWKRQFFGAKQV
ncbi:MAG: diadenylate cyclase CdaA [Desulfobulbaceae bacterium]|nr:diadenylate cyclase CdaA [Desulfobulbaceae bacterium]